MPNLSALFRKPIALLVVLLWTGSSYAQSTFIGTRMGVWLDPFPENTPSQVISSPVIGLTLDEAIGKRWLIGVEQNISLLRQRTEPTKLHDFGRGTMFTDRYFANVALKLTHQIKGQKLSFWQTAGLSPLLLQLGQTVRFEDASGSITRINADPSSRQDLIARWEGLFELGLQYHVSEKGSIFFSARYMTDLRSLTQTRTYYEDFMQLATGLRYRLRE